MNPLYYNIIHLVSIMALFAALGAVAAGASEKCGKLCSILHGLALILLLISGFGMLAKYELGFPWWITAKLIIWLAMGAMLGLAKRKVLPCASIFAIILGLGTVAAVFGVLGRTFGS